VILGIVLAGHEQIPQLNVLRLQLLHQGRTDGQRHKHGKQPTLHVDSRITKLVKREGTKQPGEIMEREYACNIQEISNANEPSA
jgi:hypothetical protein